MSVDRRIKFGKPNEWGPPTIERLIKTGQDFLGPLWRVFKTNDTTIVLECDDRMTFALRSERDDVVNDSRNKGKTYGELEHADYQTRTRGFEVYLSVDKKGMIDGANVVTRRADEFTDALAGQFTKIIARWWNGKVQWPT